jgi:hypothetical protein
MIDKVLPHRVVAVHGESNFELCPDAINAGDEDRLAVFFGVQREKTSETADLPKDLAAMRGGEQLGQAGLDPVSQIDIDTRRRVSFLTHVRGTLPANAPGDKPRLWALILA